MQAAEYPQTKCKEPLFSPQGMGYTCELPALHPGPCATFSIKATVADRDKWESKNRDWQDNIGTLDIEVNP